MTSIERIASCPCGATTLRCTGEPLGQVYCHCDDCQHAHGAAYVPRAVFPAEAVTVVSGTTSTWVNRTRTMVICSQCGSHLYGEHADSPFRGVNAGNFAPSDFTPQMHLYCKHALAPVVDSLPHYLDFPAEFGGSGTLADW